jgi:hypothetical protein
MPPQAVFDSAFANVVVTGSLQRCYRLPYRNAPPKHLHGRKGQGVGVQLGESRRLRQRDTMAYRIDSRLEVRLIQHGEPMRRLCCTIGEFDTALGMDMRPVRIVLVGNRFVHRLLSVLYRILNRSNIGCSEKDRARRKFGTRDEDNDEKG